MHPELQELNERMMNVERLLAKLISLFRERDVGSTRDKPLSLKQAADFLHLSVSRMYRLIYDKKITPFQRTGRSKILFSRIELNRFLNEKEM